MMVKMGKKIVKWRIPILLISILLLIPSIWGMASTRINYDILTYLPDDIDTIKGQNILLNDFGKGAFSMVMVEGMEPKDVAKLKEQMEQIPHVDTVLWYTSLADLSVPMEVLPEEVYEAFNRGDTTMMAVFFDTSTSADETMEAVSQMRGLAGKQCFVSGMSAMVLDLKELCEEQEAIYVAIAVGLCCLVMMIFMDSWILPFLFLGSIGIAILWNMGTNVFLGEISFITKALAAVLQLAVTMDYSIFLWNSYKEQKVRYGGDKERAMAHAISNTVVSVVGSSFTTVAGFIALCFMTFTLGLDLGIVMAKGVVLGVIGCITVLPSVILIFDKPLEKTMHKTVMPDFKRLTKGILKSRWVVLALFLVIMVPAFYGQQKAAVYYNLGATLPEDMEYVIANTKLKEQFEMASTHMILADGNMEAKDAGAMLSEIEEVPGVKLAAGLQTLVGPAVPEEVLPDSIRSVLSNGQYQLFLVNSEYETASDEVNAQIDTINGIVKKYDPEGMVIGEAPCTKDLITITDHDFQVVNAISILAIFVIIALTLKSISLPVILVAVIEFAIFINLGLPYYMGETLPFIAPICISTIQLGATVDYAILMTNRYKKERSRGEEKKKAVEIALKTSIPSIIVSALGFFAATFGVALYSDIDIISSICSLMARGAIISMFSVILILPAMFMLFDKVICATSAGFREKKSA